MANLFTSQTPASGDNSDGTPGITTATAVRFAVTGNVTGIRFYATATVGGTYTVALWDVTAADPNGSGGTLLASNTMGGAPTGGAWNSVAFDPPVAVVTTKLYKAGVFSGAGRYVFTSSFFGSDLVNGDITADANGDDPIGLGNLNQGSFTINASLAYPTNQPGSSCYFVDVEFTADVASASGTVAAVLPALTAAASGTASSTGTAAAVLPALTAAAAGTASASGAAAAALPALTVSVTGAIDLGETSSPSRTQATATRPATLATTTRDRYLATGSPGGA